MASSARDPPPPWAQRQAGSPPMSSPSLQFLPCMSALEFVSELDAVWCDYLPCSPWLIAGMHLANIGFKMQPEIHWKVKPHSEPEAFFPYLMPYGKHQSSDGSPACPAQDCESERPQHSMTCPHRETCQLHSTPYLQGFWKFELHLWVVRCLLTIYSSLQVFISSHEKKKWWACGFWPNSLHPTLL